MWSQDWCANSRSLIFNKPPFSTSFQRKLCCLTTEKTDSSPCLVISLRAFRICLGCRHGEVALMLHMTSTSARKHQIRKHKPIAGKVYEITSVFLKLKVISMHNEYQNKNIKYKTKVQINVSLSFQVK